MKNVCHKKRLCMPSIAHVVATMEVANVVSAIGDGLVVYRLGR
jgi:hypothetical protein